MLEEGGLINFKVPDSREWLLVKVTKCEREGHYNILATHRGSDLQRGVTVTTQALPAALQQELTRALHATGLVK